jgi:ribosomal protein S27AE
MDAGQKQVEALHEFLIEAETIGAIGNIAANLVFGELPKLQATILMRSISAQVERRVEEAMAVHSGTLDALAVAPKPARAPGRSFWLYVPSEDERKDLPPVAHLFADDDLEKFAPCGASLIGRAGMWLKLARAEDIAAVEKKKAFCPRCLEGLPRARVGSRGESSPACAPHVTGRYPPRRYDPQVGGFETVTVELSCSKCGDVHKVACSSGQPRSHVANYAVVHLHRDALAPVPLAKR